MNDAGWPQWTLMRPLSASYRLQLGLELDFDAAGRLIPYLSGLGVSHLYLSPVLEAAPGSTHGYDVVDHRKIATILGGRDGLERLADQAHAQGLGIILDIVPNHMAVPTPMWHNKALWSVLGQGSQSPYAHWFDIDWSAGKGAIVMPVLGDRIGEVLDKGELQTVTEVIADGAVETMLCYHDHRFPLCEGSDSASIEVLLEQQHYRLAYWKLGNEELNYRRFFDIDSLLGLRIEDPDVFSETHGLLFELIEHGLIDGLRVDHPDGLADPAGYLERLSSRTGSLWTVVEKILAPHEHLPSDWSCDGTTGYDSCWRLHTLFIDPEGRAPLGVVMHDLTGDGLDEFAEVVRQSKHDMLSGPLLAELQRLSDVAYAVSQEELSWRDHARHDVQQALEALLLGADQYRYYRVPGKAMSDDERMALQLAFSRARMDSHEELMPAIDMLEEFLMADDADGLLAELQIRFQQTCGALMAKGLEDTAFYRWTHLTGLCEVGGAPERFSIDPDQFHAWCRHLQSTWPHGMTTLSTHDNKRSEDVRIRLGVLSEFPDQWQTHLRAIRALTTCVRPELLDGRMENQVWQTLAATWTETGPLSLDRLNGFFIKAARESRTQTSWVNPSTEYEAALSTFVAETLAMPGVVQLHEQWLALTRDAVACNTLGIKLLQICMPGIPDVYQGCELTRISLVDPDNRLPVDWEGNRKIFEQGVPCVGGATLDHLKCRLTHEALTLRQVRREAFCGSTSGYEALLSNTGHVLGFSRSCEGTSVALAVATRLSQRLKCDGGWQAHHQILLPHGRWINLLDETIVYGGQVPLASLLEQWPVALLMRDG